MGLAGFGEVLGIKRSHFFDQTHVWLQFGVFVREDQRGIDGRAGEVACEDGEDLGTDVCADVVLGFVG